MTVLNSGNPSPEAVLGGLRESCQHQSDFALIGLSRAGSRAAAEELAARYWDQAYKTAVLILRDPSAAEDVAQESLLAAFGNLNRFRSSKPFGPWLHRITVNRAIDWQRAYRRRREYSGLELDAQARELEPLPQKLLDGLAILSTEDRAIVVLRHLWGYKSREIGQMVSMSTSTVRTRLQRALAVLRDYLEVEENKDDEA